MNSSTIPSSISILQQNDFLLKNKINTLADGHKYQSEIENYFNSVNSFGSYDSNDPTLNRTMHVTASLRDLWVVLHRKPETFRIFEDFERLEKLLFEFKNYRGHYIHQFNVFLVGYYLLSKIQTDSERITETFRRYSNKPYFTWMLASTFHDMGYPLQQIDAWFSKYLNMFLKVDAPYKIEIERLLTPMFFEYVKFLSETHSALKVGRNMILGQNTSRDWQFQSVLLTKLRNKDHGVLSALLLIHSLLTQEKLAQNRTWLRGDFSREIMTACHAISIHNLHSEDIQISFKQFPFAFLLALCDDLQDWGRSSDGIDHSELTNLEIVSAQGIPEINFTIRINTNKRRIKEENLDGLRRKLITNNLIKIKISDENSNKIWSIGTD